MTKSRFAKLLGWGQLAVVYINQLLAANGGVIPQTRQQWMVLGASLLTAGSVHHASNTSADNPSGQK